ncbi:MAG: PEP/pyruvate-binding domain-containing protein [Thermoanaerobacterales bacterium]|nr:PEP/pyruvate-binding domain-containing protein [Thermoanaerobacterales bacterium]
MDESCKASFLSWPEAFKAGAGVVGGKGWNLARLDRYGFRIPPGGVFSARSYLEFLVENDLAETLERLAQKITIENIGESAIKEELFVVKQRIESGRVSISLQEGLISKLRHLELLDKPLAVRSSASAEDSDKASFAGILESFLNVRGLDNVLSAIKRCYASLWTPQAVTYRRKMGIRDDEVLPAVVIMEMVEAEAAGVGFTCDPRTGREDVLVLNCYSRPIMSGDRQC